MGMPRGILLMPIAAKIYNKFLLNRLIPFVGPILCKNQNGFRRGRSTLSQILFLRRMIEESNLSNLYLALVFVDFSKAFDSVDRSINIYHKGCGTMGVPVFASENIELTYISEL